MKRYYKLYIKWAAFIQYAFMWHLGLLVCGVPYHDFVLFGIATEKV